MTKGKYLCALLALSAITPASGEEPATPAITLEPSSPWVADFKDESCAIRRSFSGGGQEAVVEFDNYGMSDGFDVIVSGITLKELSGTPRAAFEPDDNPQEQIASLRGSFADGTHGVIYGGVIFSQHDIDARRKLAEKAGHSVPWDKEVRSRREAEITRLFLANAFESDLLFETGALNKPMAVMRQCIDDFVKSKGLDPAALATLSREVTPKQQMIWAQRTQEAYPPDLVREHKNGTVRLRLLVDETGKPIDCYAQPRGEDARFDAAACKSTLKNAQFDPALDAAGKPIKAYWATTVIYSLR